jgi:MFS transporter, ACS family, D-galactonate transporter
MTWLPDYLVEVRRLPIMTAGAFAALPFLVWVVAEPAGGWFADRLIERGRDPTCVRKGVIAAAFLCGLLLVPAARVASVTAAMVLICGSSLVGFGSGNILVIFQTCAPPREVGTWMGIGNFSGNIGGVLSPLITGFLIGRTGSYFAGFALAPVVLLVGLMCFVFIIGKIEPPSP